jgi:hypothetical protein
MEPIIQITEICVASTVTEGEGGMLGTASKLISTANITVD